MGQYTCAASVKTKYSLQRWQGLVGCEAELTVDGELIAMSTAERVLLAVSVVSEAMVRSLLILNRIGLDEWKVAVSRVR